MEATGAGGCFERAAAAALEATEQRRESAEEVHQRWVLLVFEVLK